MLHSQLPLLEPPTIVEPFTKSAPPKPAPRDAAFIVALWTMSINYLR